MATFAHIETGAALDPIERESADAYRALFAQSVTQSWTVAEVPDGTQHGAMPNGDGTYTNPANPQPQADVVFDKADFKEYAYGVLGTIALPNGTAQQKLEAGLARFGAIIMAADASTDASVFAAYDQYKDANSYRKEKVSVFLGILVTATIVTNTEYAAIISNWPTV